MAMMESIEKLREPPKAAVDIREVAAECERVKARLLKAVRKAVGA